MKLTTFSVSKSNDKSKQRTDSGSTIKINVRLRRVLFVNNCLSQQLFTNKDFCMELKLCNIFKITKATMFKDGLF